MGKFIIVIIRKVEPLFVSFIYSRLYFVDVLSLTSKDPRTAVLYLPLDG